MLVSEMRRQEATYFLMNWETRGSEQGLTEEWARGLCSWPGSVAEGQHRSVTSQPSSHHVHPTPQHWEGIPLLGGEGVGSGREPLLQGAGAFPAWGYYSALQMTLEVLM